MTLYHLQLGLDNQESGTHVDNATSIGAPWLWWNLISLDHGGIARLVVGRSAATQMLLQKHQFRMYDADSCPCINDSICDAAAIMLGHCWLVQREATSLLQVAKRVVIIPQYLLFRAIACFALSTVDLDV
jgi:hypothetical protein